MNCEPLKKHIIDTVKEWQMKIGYRAESMKLYYPAASLAKLLELPEDAEISFYDQGEFVDLCAGPHLDSTGRIKGNAIKLTQCCGAYWRGDSNRKMLQRIYAVAFPKKEELDEIVEQSLRGAAIWDEVKDRLKKSALGLSGGQQQRLCIARALAVQPQVLLMDEPTSALDPISTSKIEELATNLKEQYTIIIVTHNMQQALRISDKTAFFLLGELIEYDDTQKLFYQPKEKRTEDYITGRFG